MDSLNFFELLQNLLFSTPISGKADVMRLRIPAKQIADIDLLRHIGKIVRHPVRHDHIRFLFKGGQIVYHSPSHSRIDFLPINYVAKIHSTVTLLARFLGISTSLPRRIAISKASSCTTTNISKNSSIGWS